MDLTYLLDHLAADPFFKKFRHLNEKLAEVIQDYSLVSFVPLNVQVWLLIYFLKIVNKEPILLYPYLIYNKLLYMRNVEQAGCKGSGMHRTSILNTTGTNIQH